MRICHEKKLKPKYLWNVTSKHGQLCQKPWKSMCLGSGKQLEKLHQIWGKENYYLGNEKRWKTIRYFNQELNGGAVLGDIFICAALPTSVTRWGVKSWCRKYELFMEGNVQEREKGSPAKRCWRECTGICHCFETCSDSKINKLIYTSMKGGWEHQCFRCATYMKSPLIFYYQKREHGNYGFLQARFALLFVLLIVMSLSVIHSYT